MKISIAMTTFCCEKYVIEQLQTLFKQTRRIDEVVICDDNSTDNTKHLVRNFILANHLSNSWHFIENDKNKGCLKNFIHCALQTTGDIVFYCDHDDIWDLDKVEVMENCFLKQPDALVVASRYRSVAADGITPSFNGTGKECRDGSLQQIHFSKIIQKMILGGATMAARREIIEKTSALCLDNGFWYDVTPATIAAANHKLYILNRDLMSRRVHSNNLSSPSEGKIWKEKRLKVNNRIQIRKYFARFFSAMEDELQDVLTIEERENISAIAKMMDKRVVFLEKRQFWLAWMDFFSKNPMTNKGWLLADLYCMLFGLYHI